MEPETVRTGAGKCLEILTDYCTQLRLFVVGFSVFSVAPPFASRRKDVEKIESTELRYWL